LDFNNSLIDFQLAYCLPLKKLDEKA